jgi:hypothetical protein
VSDLPPGPSEELHPLQMGWYLGGDCLRCEDLGCSTRGFTSIPTTWYFILATMTTVGYGDHYPSGVPGKAVTGAVMLIGIMVLAMPIIVIGNAFEETIKEQERWDRERQQRLKIKQLERFGSGGNAAKVSGLATKLYVNAASVIIATRTHFGDGVRHYGVYAGSGWGRDRCEGGGQDVLTAHTSSLVGGERKGK